jgi:hypothetical protein
MNRIMMRMEEERGPVVKVVVRAREEKVLEAAKEERVEAVAVAVELEITPSRQSEVFSCVFCSHINHLEAKLQNDQMSFIISLMYQNKAPPFRLIQSIGMMKCQ